MTFMGPVSGRHSTGPPMKITGYCIYYLSLLWLLMVQLHTLTHLLQAPTDVPPALRCFWALPLPHHAAGEAGTWPLVLGIGGAITGTLLAKLPSPSFGEKYSQKYNPEESEV